MNKLIAGLIAVSLGVVSPGLEAYASAATVIHAGSLAPVPVGAALTVPVAVPAMGAKVGPIVVKPGVVSRAFRPELPRYRWNPSLESQREAPAMIGFAPAESDASVPAALVAAGSEIVESQITGDTQREAEAVERLFSKGWKQTGSESTAVRAPNGAFGQRKSLVGSTRERAFVQRPFHRIPSVTRQGTNGVVAGDVAAVSLLGIGAAFGAWMFYGLAKDIVAGLRDAVVSLGARRGRFPRGSGGVSEDAEWDKIAPRNPPWADPKGNGAVQSADDSQRTPLEWAFTGGRQILAYRIALEDVTWFIREDHLSYLYSVDVMAMGVTREIEKLSARLAGFKFKEPEALKTVAELRGLLARLAIHVNRDLALRHRGSIAFIRAFNQMWDGVITAAKDSSGEAAFLKRVDGILAPRGGNGAAGLPIHVFAGLGMGALTGLVVGVLAMAWQNLKNKTEMGWIWLLGWIPVAAITAVGAALGALAGAIYHWMGA